MNYLRIIITVFIVCAASSIEAKWPNDFTNSEEKSAELSVFNKRSRIFDKRMSLNESSPFYVIDKLSHLNKNFVTGSIKKDKNNFARILHWDFKVKFQISKNMNIIFSYN